MLRYEPVVVEFFKSSPCQSTGLEPHRFRHLQLAYASFPDDLVCVDAKLRKVLLRNRASPAREPVLQKFFLVLPDPVDRHSAGCASDGIRCRVESVQPRAALKQLPRAACRDKRSLRDFCFIREFIREVVNLAKDRVVYRGRRLQQRLALLRNASHPENRSAEVRDLFWKRLG